MKKITVSILTAALLLTALFHFGAFTASAAEGAPCIADSCTGSYINGICSADATHYQPAVGNGVGANGQPLFEISNAGQLFWFAEHVNVDSDNEKANAILKADIDLNPGYTFTFIPDTGLVEVKQNGTAVAYLGTGIKGDTSGMNTIFDEYASHGTAIYANADDGLEGPVELLSGLRAWTPIGVNQYSGSFYGNGKTVSGLYIHSLHDYQGLFGHSKGMIRHVGAINFYISANSCTGGVVGGNSGNVIGCYSNGICITSEHYYYYIGGVVGENYGDVTGCYNMGFVNGNNCAGGVVGENFGDVTGCYNTGIVNGYNYAGGVAGSNYGNLKGCYNEGSVSGSENSNSIGGVVGSNDSDTVECYNTGTVSVGEYAVSIGGVAGANYGNVRSSYNEGNISSGDNSYGFGGVAGISHGDIRNCYNEGNISIAHNGSYAGGVVGYNYGGIRSSYNTGNVSSGDSSYDIGGVVGTNSGNVKNSYNEGNVSCGDNSHDIGGVVGYNTSNVKNSYNTGNVSGGDNSYNFGGVAGVNEESGMALIVNTYYLTGTAACGIGNNPEDVFSAAAKTEAEFKNGTVAWLLNEFIGYDVFGQTLAGDQKDPSPVFLTDSNKIYFGYTTCDAAQMAPVYSNVSTATAQKPTHTMAAATCTAPSTCTVCGHTEGEALGHSYDNTCDTACNTCGETRTVGEHLDSDGNSLCDACGTELPKNGLPTGAIVGIAIGAVVLLGGGGFGVFWFVIKKKRQSDLSHG